MIAARDGLVTRAGMGFGAVPVARGRPLAATGTRLPAKGDF
jgi:hypothetical protein